MYNFNGFYPVVRCICGAEIALQKATLCKCGATIWVSFSRNKAHLYGFVPDGYDYRAQPHRLLAFADWKFVDEKKLIYCPACHKRYDVGLEGIFEGCDECTHTRRDENGLIVC